MIRRVVPVFRANATKLNGWQGYVARFRSQHLAVLAFDWVVQTRRAHRLRPPADAEVDRLRAQVVAMRRH
jgi:hypothetical protein